MDERAAQQASGLLGRTEGGPQRSNVSADTTKANLIDAADKEIRSIGIADPDTLRRVRMDETTDRYYICQLCGSTLLGRRPAECSICGNSALHYRQISWALFG